MAPTPENAPCWHDWHRPREICYQGHHAQISFLDTKNDHHAILQVGCTPPGFRAPEQSQWLSALNLLLLSVMLIP